jgi:hypothetical protein
LGFGVIVTVSVAEPPALEAVSSNVRDGRLLRQPMGTADVTELSLELDHGCPVAVALPPLPARHCGPDRDGLSPDGVVGSLPRAQRIPVEKLTSSSASAYDCTTPLDTGM